MPMSRASFLWMNITFIAGSFLAVLGRRHHKNFDFLSSLGKLPSMSSVPRHKRELTSYTTQLVVDNAIEGYYSTRTYDDDNCTVVNTISATTLNRCLSYGMWGSLMYTGNATSYSATTYKDEKCSVVVTSTIMPETTECRSKEMISITPTTNFPPTNKGITKR